MLSSRLHHRRPQQHHIARAQTLKLHRNPQTATFLDPQSSESSRSTNSLSIAPGLPQLHPPSSLHPHQHPRSPAPLQASRQVQRSREIYQHLDQSLPPPDSQLESAAMLTEIETARAIATVTATAEGIGILTATTTGGKLCGKCATGNETTAIATTTGHAEVAAEMRAGGREAGCRDTTAKRGGGRGEACTQVSHTLFPGTRRLTLYPHVCFYKVRLCPLLPKSNAVLAPPRGMTSCSGGPKLYQSIILSLSGRWMSYPTSRRLTGAFGSRGLVDVLSTRYLIIILQACYLYNCSCGPCSV